ncbi:DgyrCDS4877 [Dimorphilus gyrociliatus]|uniref:DgyrCDS4877 n=1 Tax=Dimorphilus gyrociliatus TaxID=2664684 RepID=A0A7I8VMZ9_9ANNE|nr:DgyrCDS4877 [Dimorphilus gyrociliatus]
MLRKKDKKHEKEIKRLSSLTQEDLLEHYKSIAEDAWKNALEILDTNDGWKTEQGSCAKTGMVTSRSFDNFGKVFKLVGEIDASAEDVFEELVINIDGAPSWNPTLSDTRLLLKVTDNIDISYQVAADAIGGLVSTRDFVNLRHWGPYRDYIVSSGCSVIHPDYPPISKVEFQLFHIFKLITDGLVSPCVRGDNKAGGWVFHKTGKNKCTLMWLVSTDLKGWLPQFTVDLAMSKTLMQFLDLVRNRMKDLGK